MEFHFEQVVPAAIDDVFAFYQNPANLTLLLRDWRRFRLLQYAAPLQPGSELWVQEAFLAIPVALGFRCTLCERPHRLGGDLFHGPFVRFSHLHEFAACLGGTRVCDSLDVLAPWFFGGEWTVRRLIAPLLRRAFESRQRTLFTLASDGSLSGHMRPAPTPEISTS